MGRRFGVLFLLLVAGGCRQILGADDYGVKAGPVGPPIGKCDRLSYASAACATCTSDHCCAEAAACNGELACAAMARCLATCAPDDHECRATCDLTIEKTAEFSALSTCVAANSCTECAAARVVWGRAECDQCLADSCGGAVDAFSADPSELHSGRCDVSKCSSALPACACDDYGTDAPRVKALLDCVHGPCASACSPDDWSCLGRMKDVPLSLGRDLELHLFLVNPALNVVDETPIDAFRVATCTLTGDCQEQDAGDSGVGAVSTTTGEAVLRLRPPNSVGQDAQFFDHLRVDVDDTTPSTDPSAPPPAPALVYFFPPLRRGKQFVIRRIVSSALAVSVASSSGENLDFSKFGGIVWSGESCQGGASGMKITVKPEGTVRYLPDPRNSTETNNDGVGFVWNLTKGFYTLTAKHGDDLVGTYTVRVEVGAITHLIIRPVATQ